MSEYESVQQINELFKAGRFPLERELSVGGFPFRYMTEATFPIMEMAEQGKKAFLIYSMTSTGRQSPEWEQTRHMEEEKPINEWIILIWGITRSNIIAPARAVTHSERRSKPDLVYGNKTLRESDSKIIHDIAKVRFPRFTREIDGKVDTGANMSSLHVEKWNVLPGKNRVQFNSKILSGNTIMMDLVDQVVVKTSEGQEVRPVVEFEIEIDGHNVGGARFNLNNRQHMKHPILIGQNILEKGGFLVDPNQIQDEVVTTEGVDWEALQEEYKHIKVENSIITETRKATPEEIEMLYKMLLETDISFQDIMRHLKTISYEIVSGLDP